MGDGEVGFKKLNWAMQFVVSFLVVLGFVIPIVAAAVSLDKRQDVLEKAQVTHSTDDKANWVDVWDEVDKHDDAITDVRLAQMQMETKFLEIIRRLDELKQEIERWEPSPRG